MGKSAETGGLARGSIENADPVTFLLVGSRQAPAGRPPDMSVFNVFFDTPATRPYQSYRSKLDLKRVRVASQGSRVTISIGDAAIGPFAGELRLTLYRGASLVHVETVVHTQEDRRAILYDTGLALEPASKMRFAWVDTEGKIQRHEASPTDGDHPLAVRHRALIAETGTGSVVCFPPPHQYFSPRDLTDNLKTVWYGRDHRGLDARFGFGIRQAERGGGSYVPWFNAPPGTDQRLGVFYLLSDGDAERALAETLRYTHGDRFPGSPAITRLPATGTWRPPWRRCRKRPKEGRGRRPTSCPCSRTWASRSCTSPSSTATATRRIRARVRLPEMEAMFAECARLSDGEILFLPGEEANIALGDARPGKEAGHWLYLFPRPVYWTMKRGPGQPFVENQSRLGKVYHVGTGHDMVKLIERRTWSCLDVARPDQGIELDTRLLPEPAVLQVESLARGRLESDAGGPFAGEARYAAA